MTPPADRSELLVEAPAEALAGLLGVAPPRRDGDRLLLPPLWHWLYLLDRPAQAELGPDGHVRRDVDPADPLTTRMFAGGRVRQHAPLRTGLVAERRHTVVHEVLRQGRSGPLRFVTHRYEYHQQGRLLVEDERDLVYRAPSSNPAPSNNPAPAVDPGTLRLDTTATLLFRFSALTYNAHRIHYDREFAREEGYPGLVVHGPLQALAMAEAFRALHPDGGPGSVHLEYRLVAPLFEGQPLVARCEPGGSPEGTVTVDVRDGEGRLTATGRVSVDPPEPTP